VSVLTWHIGDTRSVLATLEPGSVDLVVTSPPFLALRSYLPADDPAKPFEMGSEATPGAFLDALLDVVEVCARVLAPHGSMCFELGDTYSGSGGAGGDYAADGLREGQPRFRQGYVRNDHPRDPAGQAADYGATLGTGGGAGRSGWHRMGKRGEDSSLNYRKAGTVSASDSPRDPAGWPLAKSLCMIPELFRVALVYGFNPLTGRETPRWRARNVIRWVRPNPPVGALGDKWRPATSEMVVICKASDRYFDQDATRTAHQSDPATFSGNGYTKGSPEGVPGNESMPGNPGGAPLLDWWKISPKGFAGSHYATFPAALCIPPIRAMCPERVCTTCGKPSRRIVEAEYEPHGRRVEETKGVRGGAGADGEHAQHMANGRATKHTTTLGWTDCGHSDWRPGVVLDPFAGSGTVLDAALGQGRSAVGIDLDRRNLDLARDRLGMFPLTVVDHLTAAESPR